MQTLTPRDPAGRMRGLLFVASLLFTVLFLRLFYLQITAAADYVRESERNRINPKRIRATRGQILDRADRVLASSRASYTIILHSTSREEDARAVAALEAAIGGHPLKYTRRGRAIRLKRDVDFREASIVAERLHDDWPLDIVVEPQRAYPYGSLASHAIGYMGEVKEEDLRNPRPKRYFTGDLIGKTGIEKVFENALRGRDGVRYIEVDVRNRIKGEFPERQQAAQPGSDLKLTIDLDLQRRTEAAMPDSLAGSIVVLDPRDGAVLAMVSAPGFDPNVFVSYQSQKERKRLVGGGSNNPMLNRAVQGRYPPGSTFKMVAAAAALELGITDTLSTYPACSGSLRVGDVVFHCNNLSGHGELNLLEALETSCNIYFHHLVMSLGMDDWRGYAARFGFGQATGIGLEPEEYSGLLPTKEYYAEKESWTWGHLLNLVIGQGAMLATPVQVARYIAALANGGYLVTPHVAGNPPPPQRIEGLSAASLDVVKKGMYRVIYGRRGTGRHLHVPGVEWAGKSGTVQVPNREENDAWFVAFAPYEVPEVVVAVVLEAGGSGGTHAGPVVEEVLKAYFSLPISRRPLPVVTQVTEDVGAAGRGGTGEALAARENP